jgi:Domain of unknown function (DUF6597)
MIRPEGPEQRGVLRARGAGPGKHARRQPAPDLLPYIDCYWMVRWDLRGRPPELAETLPHPCVYWVTEWGDSAIHGVSSARFTRVLEGRGRVFGVRFRPGGFYPFYRQPICSTGCPRPSPGWNRSPGSWGPSPRLRESPG